VPIFIVINYNSTHKRVGGSQLAGADDSAPLAVHANGKRENPENRRENYTSTVSVLPVVAFLVILECANSSAFLDSVKFESSILSIFVALEIASQLAHLGLVITEIAVGNPGMDRLVFFSGEHANPLILRMRFPFATGIKMPQAHCPGGE
jgi:hypothetical protein